MNDTRTKILDTAERLFGENGYASTSLRRIISEARVNLAAIHYHFSTKQALLDQVIMRKAGPVNERRIKLLDQFEAESAPNVPSIEQILVAFIAPVILLDKSPEFAKLMGRVYAEGLMPDIAQRNFRPVTARFFKVLRRAMPGMPEKEFLWKAHFAIGALAHTLTAKPSMIAEPEQESAWSISRMLVAFISGGFREPAGLEKEIEVNQ
jgi:AcrR family transcriptional regulator